MIRSILRLAVCGIAAGICLWVFWLLLVYAEGNNTWHGLSAAILSMLFLLASGYVGIGGLFRFISIL